MGTLMIILISAGALVFGISVGYYLRVIVALGKRRSIEIDIKQMMVSAKEEAQQITDDARTGQTSVLVALRISFVKQNDTWIPSDVTLQPLNP